MGLYLYLGTLSRPPPRPGTLHPPRGKPASRGSWHQVWSLCWSGFVGKDEAPPRNCGRSQRGWSPVVHSHAPFLEKISLRPGVDQYVLMAMGRELVVAVSAHWGAPGLSQSSVPCFFWGGTQPLVWTMCPLALTLSTSAHLSCGRDGFSAGNENLVTHRPELCPVAGVRGVCLMSFMIG